MSLHITSLNSGSNGNCYYIGNADDAVLIDAGISCRETEKRMQRLGLAMDKVRAIFVSHEHSDHINGITTLAKKYRLKVYITEATLLHARLRIDNSLVFPFSAQVPIEIGGLLITAFAKFHDAGDPHSFIVSDGKVNIGVFTDIGYACDEVVRYFKQCHAVFLEANYDPDMLNNSGYPYYLKQRITGGKGHLSNFQALELFRQHRPIFLSHLLLSHLSGNNNCPDLVNELFNRHAGNTKIIVATRFRETEVYFITREKEVEVRIDRSINYRIPEQLSLFGVDI
jgi:phosphoribosyl 1,2-cyclic phosphodiesterase